MMLFGVFGSPAVPQNTNPAPLGVENHPECKHYKGVLHVHFHQILLNFTYFPQICAFNIVHI